MREFFLLLLFAPLLAVAARVEYSASGVVSFSETTPAGDFTAIFKRCLANDIFTFSRVNLAGRHVNYGMDSDNIGPFLIEGAAGLCHWVGGNHLDENGVPTAECQRVEIFTDDTAIDTSSDFSCTCSVMTVKVVNLLKHSALGEVAVERVTYIVSGNSIQVEVSHEFTGDSPRRIYTYYGMQSMFGNEDRILVPGYGNCGWIEVEPGADLSITKAEAPGMRLFVESNGSAMQASLLYPEGLGDHGVLKGTDAIFVHSGIGKSYHSLIKGLTVTKGETISWRGLYSWFENPLDDTFDTAAGEPLFSYPAWESGVYKVVTAAPSGEVIIVDPASPSGLWQPAADDGGGDISVHDLNGRRIGGSIPATPGIYIVSDGIRVKKVRIN